jgi:hypothetical protein
MTTIEISVLKLSEPFIKNINTVISHFEWYLAKNKKNIPFFQEKKSSKDMLDMLKRLSIQTEASQLRKILQKNWNLNRIHQLIRFIWRMRSWLSEKLHYKWFLRNAQITTFFCVVT